jgi:hypothetical protein
MEDLENSTMATLEQHEEAEKEESRPQKTAGQTLAEYMHQKKKRVPTAVGAKTQGETQEDYDNPPRNAQPPQYSPTPNKYFDQPRTGERDCCFTQYVPCFMQCGSTIGGIAISRNIFRMVANVLNN